MIVFGVHSPEISYAKEAAKVKQAIKDLNVPEAVAMDNDFKVWNMLPSMVIRDKQGRSRFANVADGGALARRAKRRLSGC